MIRGLDATTNEVSAELVQRGLRVAPNALKPLRRIDFERLKNIYDHEEAFLRTVFIDSLVNATNARRKDEGPTARPEVTAQDVRVAMLMLGTATANASDAQFSNLNKTIIKDVCPYCS